MKHTVKIGHFGCWHDSDSIKPAPDDIVAVDVGNGIVSSFITVDKPDSWCNECDMPFMGNGNDGSDRLCSRIPIKCQGDMIFKSIDTLLEHL